MHPLCHCATFSSLICECVCTCQLQNALIWYFKRYCFKFDSFYISVAAILPHVFCGTKFTCAQPNVSVYTGVVLVSFANITFFELMETVLYYNFILTFTKKRSQTIFHLKKGSNHRQNFFVIALLAFSTDCNATKATSV